MVHKILTGAGFVLNKTYRETRFLKPPKSTYAVYNDTRTVRGPDNINAIVSHEVNIELYEYSPDSAAEARIEAQLDEAGLEYIKQSRYWLSEEQLYQVIYEFNFTEKKGNVTYEHS
jgi:hypothetical protein